MMKSSLSIIMALWFISAYLDYDYGFTFYLIGKEYNIMLPDVPNYVVYIFVGFVFVDMILDRVLPFITHNADDTLVVLIWRKIKPYFKTKTYTGNKSLYEVDENK